MKIFKLLIYSTIIISVLSCSNDDNNNSNNPTLTELRQESTTVLTSGSTKTWRINQAILENGSSTIDISNNFNVVDDEFIFGGTGENGTLEWRKGYEVKTNASNNTETLTDKYVSSVLTNFSYQSESSTVVEADFGSCTFEINADDTINATITNEDNTVFKFTLGQKAQGDFLIASNSGLNFTSAFTFESNAIAGLAPGMIGSYVDNSFFIVTREDGLNGGPERILKFDLGTNSVSEKLFFQSDFVSKQLHIIDDQLIVIGGRFVNQYNINLSGNPVTASHGKGITRFGISVLNNDAYIIGGDTNDVEGDKIFKWDINSKVLSEFATLPVPKYGARGTIVADNLYVFGGTEKFIGGTPTNTIYRINIANPSQVETFQMNKALDFSFVQKYQNLIYVAGFIHVYDPSGGAAVIGREFVIGVFNTLDNTYQELTTNLTKTSGFDAIHQMCIFNDKMYIIYGNGTDKGGQFPEWDVLVSNLN